MSIAVLDLFAPPRITAQRRADGTILVRSIEDLEPLQRARGLRPARPAAGGRPRVRGGVLLAPALPVLRRGRAARGVVGPPARRGRRGRRPPGAADRVVGTTETAPGATTAHFAAARCGCIGVPLPGVTLKLAPEGTKREIRVAGPNVTPG